MGSIAMITWLDGKDLRSHMENPDKICDTEEEALAPGLEAAQAWINKEQ